MTFEQWADTGEAGCSSARSRCHCGGLPDEQPQPGEVGTAEAAGAHVFEDRVRADQPALPQAGKDLQDPDLGVVVTPAALAQVCYLIEFALR